VTLMDWISAHLWWKKDWISAHLGWKMGCDINIHLEYVDSRGSLEYFAEINLLRNYDMFGIMAGVRGGDSLYDPKGLPSDPSHRVIECCTYYVAVNPLDASPESSETEMLATARYFGSGRLYNPDLHNFSWLSLKEYKNVLKAYSKKYGKPNVTWESILISMKFFKKRGFKPRLVFWFEG